MAAPVQIDRRTTMAWMIGALAVSGLAACEKVGDSSWPELAMIKAPGIGKDPNLKDPKVPWPLTLKRGELATTAALADLIMPAEGASPAASKVGVPAFINEWVSAPYESQHKDRNLIVPGLAWLDRQSKERNGRAFAKAKPADQKAILDDIAWKEKVKAGFEKPAEFFTRFRSLTVGAYFTSPQGWKDLGYQGNTASPGVPYPGPTPEAIAHMKGLVESMGLKFTAP